MKLQELKEQKGTYAALRVLQPSTDLLYEHCRSAGIPVRKSLFEERLHTTLIYSRKHCPKMHAEPGTIYSTMFRDYELFTSGKGEKVLVALLTAPYVEARHLQLMAKHKATYDFPIYHPHITLCNDFKGDIAGLPIITFPILLGKEYVEDLDLER